MKKLTLISRVALFVVVGSGWGFWIHDKWEQQSASTASSSAPRMVSFDGSAPTGSSYPASSASALNPANPLNGAFPARPAEMRQQYQDYIIKAQQKVLQDNPTLMAEYKEILSEFDAQRGKLNDAMIKTDPKVAPIVARLEAMHRRAVALAGTLRPNQMVPPEPPPNLER